MVANNTSAATQQKDFVEEVLVLQTKLEAVLKSAFFSQVEYCKVLDARLQLQILNSG